MPLSSAFYSDNRAPAPSMFEQLHQQAQQMYQPPPVPDLFKRPMTSAQAQPQVGGMYGNYLDQQNQQQPQQPQPTPAAPPQAPQGNQNASQMAQALLLYQMLQGGPNQFLQHLQPGNNYGQGWQGIQQQGQAFQGLQDPSVQALFNKNSYWKPGMSGAISRGYGMEQMAPYRQQGMNRGDSASPYAAFAPTPDVYSNALTFLRGILGFA